MHHRDRVAAADVVQQLGQAGPVIPDHGQPVGEDPLAAGGGQRVRL